VYKYTYLLTYLLTAVADASAAAAWPNVDFGLISQFFCSYSGLGQYPKSEFCEFLEQQIQASCPTCRTTNSVKALNGSTAEK